MKTKIHSYNVYLDGTKLLGISEEVTLPDFDALTETVSGAGVLGEIDEPVLGRFGAAEIEIPFRTLSEQMWKLADMQKSINVTLRASTQAITETDMTTDFVPSRIVIKGKNKGFTNGKMKAGEGTAPTMKLEIVYILIEENQKPRFELDKLNFVYAVNGKDLLAKVKSQI